MDNVVERIRAMRHVDEFYVKLLKKERDPNSSEDFVRAQTDGRVHWWVWYAKVAKAEYGEMQCVPHEDSERKALFRETLRRAEACLEGLG